MARSGNRHATRVRVLRFGRGPEPEPIASFEPEPVAVAVTEFTHLPKASPSPSTSASRQFEGAVRDPRTRLRARRVQGVQRRGDGTHIQPQIVAPCERTEPSLRRRTPPLPQRCSRLSNSLPGGADLEDSFDPWAGLSRHDLRWLQTQARPGIRRASRSRSTLQRPFQLAIGPVTATITGSGSNLHRSPLTSRTIRMAPTIRSHRWETQ
jgi:hypothetical protein